MKLMTLLILCAFSLISLLALPEIKGDPNEDSPSGVNLYSQVDTTFLIAESEGLNLEVRVYRKTPTRKKIPLVIYLLGSGEGSTIESNKSFTEFFFDNVLLENGFATAYFDKRGLGNSEGVWYETTFEQRALDAKNVALEVGKLDFIDEKRIFVVGHSQGGWIVQIALAEYPETFAGGISMAGPTFGVRKQLVNDYKSSFICDRGWDEEKAVKRAESRVRRELFVISLLGRKGNLRQLKLIKDFEAEPYLKKIDKPILLMFGENDPLVSPEWSITELNKCFPAGLPPNMQYFVAEGEDHFFKNVPFCFQGSRRDVPFSENSRKRIVEWLAVQIAE